MLNFPNRLASKEEVEDGLEKADEMVCWAPQTGLLAPPN